MPHYGRVISDPMTVELEAHTAWDATVTIPGLIEFDQYRVYVHSEGLAYRNAAKRLQVGWIGKQAGANFCPTNELYGFTYPQQQWIAEEAKRLHGNASPLPHIDVPPFIELDTEELDSDEE